jgi:hypothetical protein
MALKSLYSVNLDTSLSFECGAETRIERNSKGRLLIGASPMSGPLTNLEVDITNPAAPVFKLTVTNVESLASELTNMGVGEGNLVVADYFSNTAFTGCNDDGLPVLANKMEVGK